MPADRPLPEVLESLAKGVADAVAGVLPAGGAPELRARIDGAIEAALARLELVPREEYERQLGALRRLEGEVARLAARLEKLEASRAER